MVPIVAHGIRHSGGAMMTRSSKTVGDSRRQYRERTERFWLFRLVTEVRDDGVYVHFAPLHRSFRRIPATEIEAASATTYSPGTYGGWHWGIRWSLSGNTVYRLRGARGVELRLTDGSKMFIGSKTPADLEAVIHRIIE